MVGPGGDRGAQTVAPIGRFRDPSALFVMALRERKVVTNENNFSHGAWLLSLIEPVHIVLGIHYNL